MKAIYLSLQQKMVAGFGIVIIIMVVLGGFATVQMRTVRKEAAILEREYIPEIAMVSEIERSVHLVRFFMRNYGLTEEAHYLTEAQQQLETLQRQLQAVHALAEASPHLAVMHNAVTEIETNIGTFTQLAAENVQKTEEMARQRQALETAAAQYRQSCTAVFADFQTNLEAELIAGLPPERQLERVRKIALISAVIELGNTMQLATAQALAFRDPERINKIQDNFRQITQLLQELRAMTDLQENLAQLDTIQTAAQTYQTEMNELLVNWLIVQDLNQKRSDAVDLVLAQTQTTMENGFAATEKVAVTTSKTLSTAAVFLAGGLAGAAFLGILTAILITASIARQLGADPRVVAGIARQVALGDLKIESESVGKTVRGLLSDMHAMVANLWNTIQVAEQIAQGDLTVRVQLLSEQDALGQALTSMTAKLRAVLADVGRAAANVAASSQMMSSGAAEMSQGGAEQAAAAEEVSASMEQMVANIRQNADNASQMEKIALKAASDARESGEAVIQTVQAMREIIKKTAIVEEIARQTHMLSLNATIEAAKAQDYGKGFSVVASEVRALASRAQTAAMEIGEVAAQSSAIAGRAGELIRKLIPDIQKTAELVQEISAATREQSAGADQINKAVQQLDQVIQQNASVSEEIAATAGELSQQAEHLQGTISFFRTDETSAPEAVSATPIQNAAQRVLQTHVAHLPKASVKAASPAKIQGDELDDAFERF